MLEIDALNPQVAARLCSTLDVLPMLPQAYQAPFKTLIEAAVGKPQLSKNARELLETHLTKS